MEIRASDVRNFPGPILFQLHVYPDIVQQTFPFLALLILPASFPEFIRVEIIDLSRPPSIAGFLPFFFDHFQSCSLAVYTAKTLLRLSPTTHISAHSSFAKPIRHPYPATESLHGASGPCRGVAFPVFGTRDMRAPSRKNPREQWQSQLDRQLYLGHSR